MLNNIENHLGAVDRKVISLKKDGASARAVTLSRVYKTTIDDLWDAVTNKERLPRWFAHVEGEFQRGGRFQVEGNAGGEIGECDRPENLSLTWEMLGDVSWVDVALKSEGSGKARLTLTHTAKLSPHWEQYGPGATGVGWELGLLGLALHSENPDADKFDEEAFAATNEGKALMRSSAEQWGEAAINAGEEPEKARASAAKTAAFYTGEAGAT